MSKHILKNTNYKYENHEKYTALISESITLIATFSSCDKDENEPVVNYTVSFDATGGSPTPRSQTVKAGEKAVAPSSPSI